MSKLLAVLKGTDGTTLVPPEVFWLGRIPWASARLNWPAVVGDATRVNPSAKSAGVVEEDSTGAAAVVAAKADTANAVSPTHWIVMEGIVRYWLAHPQSARVTDPLFRARDAQLLTAENATQRHDSGLTRRGCHDQQARPSCR
jgi:hypothetical protein